MSVTPLTEPSLDDRGLDAVPDSPLATAITPASYFRWKHFVDFVLAVVIFVPAIIAVAVLVVLVRLTSRGPGLYRQVRVGKGGRLFTMYKIRTMRADAEERSGPVWCGAGDPRITPLGRVLRKLHLDEFPQVFNVIRGEMSLIGPRPERPEIVRVLAEEIPGYVDRLAVLPGVTGLAQINLPPDTDLASVRRKLILDLEYIRHAGPFLDVRMLLCTMARVFGLPGSVVMRLFGVRREVPQVPSDADDQPVVEVMGNGHPTPAWQPVPPQPSGSAEISASQLRRNGKARRVERPRQPR
ncbi:MAG: sugar transferase [Planctomycetota bacterium]